MKESRRSIKYEIYFGGSSAGLFTLNYLTFLIYVFDEKLIVDIYEKYVQEIYIYIYIYKGIN